VNTGHEKSTLSSKNSDNLLEKKAVRESKASAVTESKNSVLYSKSRQNGVSDGESEVKRDEEIKSEVREQRRNNQVAQNPNMVETQSE
jgi:hypothetical protein